MFILVGMARDTLIRSALIDSIRMTLCTVSFCMFSNQREPRVAMIERGIAPTARVVTGSAARTKPAVMIIIIGMTGITVHRRAAIDTILMTGATGQVRMLTRQRKCSVVMIERRALPSRGVMTCAAFRPELTIVSIVAGMARIAVSRCTSKYAIGMAGGAYGVYVAARQRERSIVMIEIHIPPAAGYMAGSTIRPKLSIMSIVAGMAARTVSRSSPEHIINMA